MVSAPTANQASLQQNAITQQTNDNIGQEQFLQLLIAQLQNQDPLNPVENQEFVAELATFSSLEQQQMQTDLLQQLIDTNKSSNTSQALSLIGTDIMTADTGFRYETGEQFEFTFQALRPGNATVLLTSESGETKAIDSIDVSRSGQHFYTLDPGQALTPGNYTLSIVSGLDGSGERMQFPAFMRGGVEGVTFREGEAMLTVNGRAVPMNSVQSIFERKQP